MNTTPAIPSLGLIGGLGVGATVQYYQELVKAHTPHGWTPHLLIIHADVNLVLTHARDGNITQLAEYLAGLVRRYRGRGPDRRCLRGNTAHLH
jgi:aspartate racemase